MVKLDVNLLRYLSSEDIRVLTAVEMGMKNHELVPGSLVASIAGLRGGGVAKILQQLCRHKLLSYESGRRYDGYRLTYGGYDYLALTALRNRGAVTQVGNQIGVGKESDVFVALNENEERVALKLHRLGRTCFRKVNDKRDYNNGSKVHSFLYMSRLAAKREFAFMQVLHERGFPVPVGLGHNRHCVVMELVEGIPLNNVTPEDVSDVAKLYDTLMDLLVSLANDCGVVHGDFNEFNLIYNPESNTVKLIDFPQMIGVDHKLAKEYFDRDVNCIIDFFKKKFNYVSDYVPELDLSANQYKDHEVIQKIVEDESVEKSNASFLEDLSDGNVIVHSGPMQASVDVEDAEGQSSLSGLVDELSIEEPKKEEEQQSVELDSDPRKVFPAHAISPAASTYEPSVAGSRFQPSVAGSTFDPQDIKKKLRREREVKEKRESLRKATQKVKGEASAVQRQRKDNRITVKEDLVAHSDGLF